MTKAKRLVVTRAKNDERSFGEIADMLLELHKSNGYAPLDADKAAEIAYRVLASDMVWVARIGGVPVGTLALVETEFWYSRETFLGDAWFWVTPAERARDVGVKLLKAARDEAQARNKLLFISMHDPDRRPKATSATLVAQLAGFVPIGYALSMNGGPS